MIIGDVDRTLVYYLIKKLTDKNLLQQLRSGAEVLIGQRPGHRTTEDGGRWEWWRSQIYGRPWWAIKCFYGQGASSPSFAIATLSTRDRGKCDLNIFAFSPQINSCDLWPSCLNFPDEKRCSCGLLRFNVLRRADGHDGRGTCRGVEGHWLKCQDSLGMRCLIAPQHRSGSATDAGAEQILEIYWCR